uniref:Uncharacterized protein n=1 Tax=Rhodnius prolixus TaxID=13249 RepID=T1IAE9_RHOPR
MGISKTMLSFTEYDNDARYPNTKEDKQEVIQTLRNVYDEITEDISKEKIEDTETESEDVPANLKKYSFKHKLHQYIKFSKNPPKFNRYPESDCEEINWSETLLPLHQAVPSGFVQTFIVYIFVLILNSNTNFCGHYLTHR